MDLEGLYPLLLIENKMEDIKKNYGTLEDIEAELKNVDLGNILDFNYEGRYEFAKCEGCDGPLLGHLEVKCLGKQGQRYEKEKLKGLENWLKRVPWFREAIEQEE